MLKLIRKTVTILLVISLVYANAAETAFGIISYALDNEESKVYKGETETQEEFVFEIETSQFYKNNMADQETEYQEKIKLNLDSEREFDEIKIYDVGTMVTEGIDEENIDEVELEAEMENEAEVDSEENIDIFYKSTKINKEELIKLIGESGSLEIQYIEIDTANNEEVDSEESISQGQLNISENENTEESIVVSQEEDLTAVITENQNDIIDMHEENENTDNEIENEEVEEDNTGIIHAQEGIVKIDVESESDEEGYITIIYPEKSVISVNINIITEDNKLKNFEMLHTRVVEKTSNIEKINLLETTKQIIVNGEEEIFNQQKIFSMPIDYTKTVAEIGIDKNQISTSVENKVNFTITMLTHEMKYDLYKNPSYIIELPSEVEKINIDNTVILNNQYFEVELIETGTLENGSKAIAIKLAGEQIEYTNSNEENIQIVIEATITTNNLIPTLEKNINLHYKNENVKTYDGIGEQEAGIDTILVNLVSNKEVIVETKATVGEETATSFKEEYATIDVAPHTYNMAKINGTVINNIGEDISNAKILGTVKNIGPVSGIENVYYTENENATLDINDVNNKWTTEYTQSAKKYLILIENFKQAQTINFEYYMYMPEVVEEDTTYELVYEVYDSNNQMLKTSSVTINQQAERFDIFQDETIAANIEIEKIEGVEVGDYVSYKVNIYNVSGNDLKNMSANIELPDTLKDILVNDNSNDEGTKAYIRKGENEINVVRLSIAKDQYISLEIGARIKEYSKASEIITATINYEGKEAVISNKMKVIKPSIIETIITSNKVGKTLEANEEIIFKIGLYNNGTSHSIVSINLPEIEAMNIQKIEAVNLTTGITNRITAGNLKGRLSGISINPGEIVEVSVVCLTKELKKEHNTVMYATISGENIEETSTEQLVNTIHKKLEEEIKTVEQRPVNDTEVLENTNVISGTAWIDKNENGQKDKGELPLKGVQAVLIDTVTGQEITKTITNNEGEYSFENIENGKYVVSFNYNTTTFNITDYKNESVEEVLDSDVINATQNNQTVAKTDVIELAAGKTENVNIGLVLNKKFDMSINKGITKVTVSNQQGTNTYDFENTNMAKVEIDGKYLKGSLILVEYEIAVTNSGEVAGYAKIISDKMPEGMKFNSELNTNWYQDDDGILYCEELSNKELLPGETAIVKLILTKEMPDDKVVSPINTVNLKETFNEYLIEEKDNENNSSEATIIISLTTGKAESYIWLVLVVIAIIGTGLFGVIKVTNKDSKITNQERRK